MAEDQDQGQEQGGAQEVQWGPPPAAELELDSAATESASAEPTAQAAQEPTSDPASDPRPGEGASDSVFAGLQGLSAPEPSPEPSPEPPAPLEFLVGPRLLPAGALHLLGGSPLAGKSTFVAQLLRQFVSPDPLFLPGLDFASLPVESLGVILTDRPWASNCDWYTKVGLSEIPHYALVDDPEAIRFMSKPTTMAGAPGVELFKFCLDRLPSTVKFVVADVLTNAFLGNIFHHAIVHKHTTALQAVLRERGLTLLGTSYGSKLKQGKTERYQRAIDRIIGASPFRGALDSVLFLDAAGESDQDYQRLTWCARRSPERLFGLQRSPETGLFFTRQDLQLESSPVQDAPLTLPGPRRPGRPVDTAADHTILDLMSPGMAVSRSELASRAVAAGVARPTAYRAFKRLLEGGQLVWDEVQGTLTRPGLLPPRAPDGTTSPETT